MNPRHRLMPAVAAVVALAVLGFLASESGARVPDPEILIEGGAALPGGDLGDRYGLLEGRAGFGAETGYEIGARFRYWFSGNWAVSPTFHYVDFGDFIGFDDSIGEYQVGTSIVRYGVDLQAFLPASEDLRLFATAGAGLYRNRYRDELFEDGYYGYSYAQLSFNTLGFCAGGGLRMGDFEFSAVYHLNRFETSRLLPGDEKQDFNWDYVSVRFGFAFPTR